MTLSKVSQLHLPNNQYESIHIGTWSSTSDVDNFFNTYNHANGYNGLKLGNYVTINDGTYNVDWMIVGFDMEHNRTAADGTLYDNGYGICMIPKSALSYSGTFNSVTSYITCAAHKYLNSTTSAILQTILGDHLILRNVLLSDNQPVSSKYISTSYIWTTAYCTLMSGHQLFGAPALYYNKYDDGEANYALPILSYITEYKSFISGNDNISTRGLSYGKSGQRYILSISSDKVRFITYEYAAPGFPLIYIR